MNISHLIFEIGQWHLTMCHVFCIFPSIDISFNPNYYQRDDPLQSWDHTHIRLFKNLKTLVFPQRGVWQVHVSYACCRGGWKRYESSHMELIVHQSVSHIFGGLDYVYKREHKLPLLNIFVLFQRSRDGEWLHLGKTNIDFFFCIKS